MKQLLCVIFFTAAAFGATACTPIRAPKLTNKQMEWLTNDGLKKYHVCASSPENPARYEIRFTSEAWTSTSTVPTGTLHASGVEKVDATTYEKQEHQFDVVYTYIFEREPENPFQQGKYDWKPTQPPVYVKSASGFWHRNADRLALEDALKFIAKKGQN